LEHVVYVRRLILLTKIFNKKRSKTAGKDASHLSAPHPD
jgi:hypothetical protein